MTDTIKYLLEDMRNDTNNIIIRRILARNPNTIAVYVGGRQTMDIFSDEENANINIYALVYKYSISYLRNLEYYEYKGTKINVTYISLNHLLEYQNDLYPVYPKNFPLYDKTYNLYHQFSLFLNLINNPNNEFLVYTNPKFSKAVDIIKENHTEISNIIIRNLAFDVNLDKYLKKIESEEIQYYDYLYLLLYFFYKNNKQIINKEYLLNIKNNKYFSEISEEYRELLVKDIKSLVELSKKNFSESSNNILNKYNEYMELCDTECFRNDPTLFRVNVYGDVEYTFVKNYDDKYDLYLGKIVKTFGNDPNATYYTSSGEVYKGSYQRKVELFEMDESLDFPRKKFELPRYDVIKIVKINEKDGTKEEYDTTEENTNIF